METLCPSRITMRSGEKAAIILPESGLMAPACSGVSTNGDTSVVFAACVVIITRCFAASGPAAATDVSVTAAISATSTGYRAFIPYLLETWAARMLNPMIDPVRFRSVSDEQQPVSRGLDEQRVFVEPDRRTTFGDARGVSGRDVDDEDVLPLVVRADDPASIGRPGPRRIRAAFGDVSPFGAVDVGHEPGRAGAVDLVAHHGHERAVGGQRTVRRVAHALVSADQDRALPSVYRDGPEHRVAGAPGAARVEERRAVRRELGLGPGPVADRVRNRGGLARGDIEHEEAPGPLVGDLRAVRRPGGRRGAPRIVRHLADPGAVDAGGEDRLQ